MTEAAHSVLRTNFEFSCDMPYDEIDDFNPQPGGAVAAALGEILKGLGCDVDEVIDGGDHGWYLDFSYRSASPRLEVTAIDGILVQVHDVRTSRQGLRGRKQAKPDDLEILTRLSDAIGADPRFHDLGWFTKDEILSRQVGAPTPLGAYSTAPCLRYFGPVGDEAPYAPPPPPTPFEPDAALVTSGWADLAPHPIRRWVARLFDLWVTTGVVFLALAIPLVIIDPKLESLDVAITLLAFIFVLSPLRGFATAALNALLLSGFATTPGKWLAGVRIIRKDGAPLTTGLAFKRELGAMAAGCGFYLPLISLITIGNNYFRLREKGATSWDEIRGLVAVQRPNSAKQAMLIVMALIPVAVIVVVLAAAGNAVQAGR